MMYASSGFRAKAVGLVSKEQNNACDRSQGVKNLAWYEGGREVLLELYHVNNRGSKACLSK